VIDTHCHLDVDAFDADRAEVLARAAAAGVTGILVPAIRPRTWQALATWARRAGSCDVRIALGVHPQIVPALAPGELPADLADALVAQIAAERPGCLAVGECGLDGGTARPDVQEAVFRAHIRAARALKLPLIIHVLRAHDAAPGILREERAHEVGGVLHSYSGGPELVPVYRDLGMCFSFAGPITYPNARKPIEAARAVPAELLLAETDAPDQSPRKGTRSEPAFVADVIAGLAAARGEHVDLVRATTVANARRLFRW